MAANHYATLGVAPHSPREVIRAAYLRLMRRYHPDKNPSAEAAERVRAITAAYAVLSVAEERAKYDATRSQRATARPDLPIKRTWPHLAVVRAMMAEGAASLAGLVKRARWHRTEWPVPKLQGGVMWARLHRAAPAALIGAGAALLVFVAYAVPGWVVSEKAVQPSSVGGKVMSSASLAKPYAAALASENEAALCSSEAVSQSITRELFRRAAVIPGSNPAALERISTYSLVRFASPVVHSDPQEGAAINCKARVVLHLPLGVMAAGRRQSVDGIVAYSVRDGGADALALKAQPALVKALASLNETPEVADLQPPIIAQALPAVSQPEIVPMPQAAPAPKIVPTPLAQARRPQPQPAIVDQHPSFSCGGQKSWAEKTVCASASLAALDRALASLWGDAMARADARQRTSLLASDKRFLASRAQCGSEACVRSAYLVAADDIRSIMYIAPVG